MDSRDRLGCANHRRNPNDLPIPTAIAPAIAPAIAQKRPAHRRAFVNSETDAQLLDSVLLNLPYF